MALAEDIDSRDDHRAAWAFTAALVCALVLPWLFAKGIFWDGAMYATISRNLAAGVGDAWHPLLTPTYMRHFHEHPPLAFWLQAIVFRALGDYFWVERVYSLATLLVTLPILVAIWRRLLANNPLAARFSWLAIVLWAPFGMWCYRHNMLENTLGICTALSVYASLRALEAGRAWTAWSALAGAAITAAILSKGPVGLFPVVTPAIAWLALRRASLARTALVQLGVMAGFAISMGLTLMQPAAREYLAGYWDVQVVSAMLGHREKIASPLGQLQILLTIATELCLPLAVAAGLAVWARLHDGVWACGVALRGPASFSLLTALSASLPLALCPKQAEHYAAPSWPFYVFAITMACLPSVLALVAAARPIGLPWQSLVCAASMAAMAGTLVMAAANFGRVVRDGSLIEAAEQLSQGLEPHATVDVTSDSWKKLPTEDRLKLHVYAYRYHWVALYAEESRPSYGMAFHRLEQPDDSLARSPHCIVTTEGLVGYPLIKPDNPATMANSRP